MDIWILCRKKFTLKELKTAEGDINVKNTNGYTPFHYICYYSGSNGFNMEMLRYCCEIMKADINNKNIAGFTPFHHICYWSHSNGFNIDMLRYCGEIMKADINVKNINGYTPFDYLCDMKNNHNILKYLGKNNLLTSETISKLSTRNKLRYFTKRTIVNLNVPNYILY